MTYRLSTEIESCLNDVTVYLRLNIAEPEQAGYSMAHFLKKRAQTARDLLLNRVTDIGDDSTVDNTEALLAVLHLYMQNVIRGVALANIDLLAQVIIFEIKERSLEPNRFIKYANAISSLTREEILVLNVYAKILSEVLSEAERTNEIFLGGVLPNAWIRFKGALVPKHLRTEEHVKVVMGGLARTGLVKTINTTFDEIGVPTFSILLREMSQMVNFEEAFNRYPQY